MFEALSDRPSYSPSMLQVAQECRRARNPMARLAPVITDIWLGEIARLRSLAPGRDTGTDAQLTPIEIELTKKALLAGMSMTQIEQIPLIHPGIHPSPAEGRWPKLIAAIIGHAEENMAATSLLRLAYWLWFLIPNGGEPADVRRNGLGFLAARGVATQAIGNRWYAMVHPAGREAAMTVPLHAYVGPEVSKVLNGATEVAVHLPNAATVYPKRSFTVSDGGDDVSRLWAHPGANTLLINGRSDMNSESFLTPGFFPMVFSGPHLLSRAFRALTLLQQLTSFRFTNAVEDIAAHVAIEAIQGDGPERDAFREGNTFVFLPQPELFTGLAMDRGIAVYLNGTATENAGRVSTLFARFDREVSSINHQ